MFAKLFERRSYDGINEIKEIIKQLFEKPIVKIYFTNEPFPMEEAIEKIENSIANHYESLLRELDKMTIKAERKIKVGDEFNVKSDRCFKKYSDFFAYCDRPNNIILKKYPGNSLLVVEDNKKNLLVITAIADDGLGIDVYPSGRSIFRRRLFQEYKATICDILESPSHIDLIFSDHYYHIS